MSGPCDIERRPEVEPRDRDLLRALVEQLEDDRVRSLPRVKRSLQQLEQGDYEFVASAQL